MAAPSFVQATTGITDAGGAWLDGSTFPGSMAVGNLVLLHVVQDGATSGAVTHAGALPSQLDGLDGGTTSTYLGQFAVGSPTSAFQHFWIARVASPTPSVGHAGSGANTTSEDLYLRWYEFANVSLGTTLATVIENGTAGATANGVGTGTTVSDTGVTTLGVDRLAINLVGLNDDVAIDAFAGETGGDWTEATAEYAESSGTDGAIQLQVATMAAAGTINGGTDTIVTAGWGVVGFALIGTTPSGPQGPFFGPHTEFNQAVMRGSVW